MANAPEELGYLADSKHWDRRKILEWHYNLNSTIGEGAVARLGVPKADISIVYAYIPATPENIAALKALFEKIDELNGRLAAVLNQQAIKRTISLLASGNLMLEKK